MISTSCGVSIIDELVQHAVDLDGGDRRPLKRRQQHAAQRIAQRDAEAALERLDHDGRLAVRPAARLDVELLRLDQVLPVLLDHAKPRHKRAGAKRQRRPQEAGCLRGLGKPNERPLAGPQPVKRAGASAAGSRCAE
jgi:hypothetical protein